MLEKGAKQPELQEDAGFWKLYPGRTSGREKDHERAESRFRLHGRCVCSPRIGSTQCGVLYRLWCATVAQWPSVCDRVRIDRFLSECRKGKTKKNELEFDAF